MFFVLILIFAGVAALYYYLIFTGRAKLKATYEMTLRGNDKRKALEAGRAYYRSLRGGNLSIYDEQAIANDISTMSN